LHRIIRHGDCQELARRSGHGPATWARWQRAPETDEEFTNTGRWNPLDVLNVLVQFVRERDGGVDEARPLAQWISRLCGGFFVVEPEFDLSKKESLLKVVSRVLKKTGETIEELWKDVEDGQITEAELARIEDEATEAQAALEALKMYARAQGNGK